MDASVQWVFGPFRLDPGNACLWRGEQPIALRPKLLALLVFLVRHAGQLVAKEALLEAVWPETAVSDAVLKDAIGRLRRVLGESAQVPQCITTVHRQGYRFMAPVTQVAPPAAVRAAAPGSLALSEALAPPSLISSDTPQATEAERRQLTVLFCDLVDSTTLAGQLDPEDLREIMQAYHQTCAEVVERFDGYVAQYLGDGVLVYFGYPMAHEDDAQRAVWTGLDILSTVDPLNDRVEVTHGVQLAVRVGIYTGLVVVGRASEDGSQDLLAFGEAPNIAARLQSLASPNQVVLSEETRRLAGEGFTYEDLGVKALKGVRAPLQMYYVMGERLRASRFDATVSPSLTPLIGREEELALISRRWEQAKAGEGQVVLISGEAGIGQSRLVHTLRERVANEPQHCVQYQCSPYYRNSPFYPFRVQFEQAAQLARNDSSGEKLTKLEALFSESTEALDDVVPLVAALMSIPTGGRYPKLTLSSWQQRTRTINVLADHLGAFQE